MRYVIIFALLAVAQLYSSMYYAVFFTIYSCALFACLCLMTRPPLRRMIGPAVMAGVVALALAVPLARVYSKAQLGDRAVDTVTYYSATTADYLRAHPRSAQWANRGLPGRMPERALFPGVMILLLAAVGLVPRFGATRAAYAVALIVAFEMSRGFNSPFYPYLYDGLAFVRGLRVPARASVLVGMTLALFAAFGVRRLISGRTLRLQQAALAILVVRDRHRLAPGAAAGAGLARATANLRTRRRVPGRRSRRVSVRRQSQSVHSERALHVLLAVALGRDAERLQRTLAVRSS